MNLLELTETQRLLRANLKALRADLDWSQEILAEKAGVSEGYIKQLETGRVWVGVETITALAIALGVPESRLFADPAAIPRDPAAEGNEKRLALISAILAADDVDLRLLSAFVEDNRIGIPRAKRPAGKAQDR